MFLPLFGCCVAQASEREAAIEALQKHTALSSSPIPRRGPEEGPPSEGDTFAPMPMQFRYFALRRPLATAQDEDFFLNLAHAAHKGEFAPSETPSGGPPEGPLALNRATGEISRSSPGITRGRDKLQPVQQQRTRTAAATTAATATAEEAPRLGFDAGPLPPNFVAIDRLGLRGALARDERICNKYAAKLQVNTNPKP